MRRTARPDQFQNDDALVAERVRARVERRAYSVNDYCRAMSIGRSTAYNLMREGKLPYFTLGGRRHISADVIEQQIRGEHPSQAHLSPETPEQIATKPRPTRRRKREAA
jgi:predicted DNA-binding transcriptional regulator AlpA